MPEVIPPDPPVWDAATFAAGLQALLPTGAVWPRDADAIQSLVMLALVPTYVRNTDAASALIADFFPSTAVSGLPDWEYVLGLPDPCAGPDLTIAARQAHVVARLTAQDGPSIPSLIAFAAALGFTITIQEFAPARFGQPFGDFAGDAWAHTWQVTLPADVDMLFPFDEGRFGEPFATFGDAVLRCEMIRLSPAHTVVLFSSP